MTPTKQKRMKKAKPPTAKLPSKSELQWAKLAGEHASRLRQIAEIIERVNESHGCRVSASQRNAIYHLAKGGKP